MYLFKNIYIYANSNVTHVPQVMKKITNQTFEPFNRNMLILLMFYLRRLSVNKLTDQPSNLTYDNIGHPLLFSEKKS